jgi:hypothetical protein
MLPKGESRENSIYKLLFGDARFSFRERLVPTRRWSKSGASETAFVSKTRSSPHARRRYIVPEFF